jgi:hypothetical protein
VTWEHHLGNGFFGINGLAGMRWGEEVKGAPPEEQARRSAAFKTVREDFAHAFDEVQDVIDAFFRTLSFPESQPFSGGVLDAWPARMVDGLGLARREWQAIQMHHSNLAREQQRREEEAKRHG